MKTKNYTLLLALVLLQLGLHAQAGHLPEAIPTSLPVIQKALKQGKLIKYHLYVTDTIVNYAGKKKRAIAVNGQIPMPTLTFTEGDTAEIVVHNQLKESTSLHWHGVFLPNKEDGVPWLTQKTNQSGYNLYVSLSNHSARHTLVPFAFRFAGTDWNVRQFYNEEAQ